MAPRKRCLHAAYIPNFHTNLISTILLHERGEIYLDEYTMQLQRKPNRECYAQLHTHYRMTVAEYNPIQYATLEAGSNYTTSPTQPRKKAGAKNTNTFIKGVTKSSVSLPVTENCGHAVSDTLANMQSAAFRRLLSVLRPQIYLRAPKNRNRSTKYGSSLRPNSKPLAGQRKSRTDRSSKFAGI